MVDNPISDQFEHRLQLLPFDASVAVCIKVKAPSELEEKLKLMGGRNTPERRELIRTSYDQVLAPLRDYFREVGVEHNENGAPLGILSAALSVAQIYDLAQRDYVHFIIEDQPLSMPR